MGVGKIPLFTIVWNIENKRGIGQDQTPLPHKTNFFSFFFTKCLLSKEKWKWTQKSYTQYGIDFSQNPT